MPIGPGKYDAHATRIRQQTGAPGVIVIVFDPSHPERCGFAVQATKAITLGLPSLLRDLADSIDKDVAKDVADA
jgi:hypothetical protein